MGLQITDANIDELLLNSSIMMVDFYADWCGPCKMLAPIIDELATEITDVTIGKLNVTDNILSSNKYEITGIPCIIFFKDGVEVLRMKGATSKAILKKKIEEVKG